MSIARTWCGSEIPGGIAQRKEAEMNGILEQWNFFIPERRGCWRRFAEICENFELNQQVQMNR